MTTDPAQDRSALLRRTLVATVDSSPLRPSPPRVPRVLAAAAALLFVAAAGGVTGGAITATAIGAPSGTIAEQGLSDGVTYALSPDSYVYGEPREASGTGELVVDAGERPLGANLLAVVFSCVDPGTYLLSVDDEGPSTVLCDADVPALEGDYLSVIPNSYPTWGDGAHRFSVRSDDGGRFDLWLAWIQRIQPEMPEPSPEQMAALADGTVTEEEYRAGFDRYLACVTAAGVELDMLPEEDGRINFGIPESGLAASDSCYEFEWSQLDAEWQTRDDPMAAEVLEYWRICLEELGLEPAPTSHLMIQRLNEAGIDQMRCREFAPVPTP